MEWSVGTIIKKRAIFTPQKKAIIFEDIPITYDEINRRANQAAHCLQQAGPADVFFSTWSAATADIAAAHRFLQNGQIKSLKFLVDYSFQSRKPEFCQELIDAFGHDALRVTVTHAKSVLITNDEWNLVVRTSMNLNYNPRFENFEISESKEFADFMKAIINEIWTDSKAAEGFDCRPADNKKRFKGIFQKETSIFENLVDGRDLT